MAPPVVRPWLLDAVALCRRAGLTYQTMHQRLMVPVGTCRRAVAENKGLDDLPADGFTPAEDQDAAWYAIEAQVLALREQPKARAKKRALTRGGVTWGRVPEHQQAVQLMRSAGMSRLGIMHELDIHETQIEAALKLGELAGLDMASRAACGAGGADDHGIWERIGPAVREIMGRATPEEPAPAKPAPPPLCAVALSLMARGIPEAEARRTAAQHRQRVAAQRELYKRAAIYPQPPKKRRVGQGFRMGGGA